MTDQEAEVIGARALAWLAGQEDLLAAFLGTTGASAGDLRVQAGDADFLGAVLDFLTMNDAWVVAFCEAEGLDFEAPMRARAALPGGGEVHWT